MRTYHEELVLVLGYDPDEDTTDPDYWYDQMKEEEAHEYFERMRDENDTTDNV